uniref:DnaJ heat shock protein family (Hsp40) member A1 n=1 Tax=Oncorhynchus kisutch TaxID=8019 RepID=A0A8C7HGK4_ONCKI
MWMSIKAAPRSSLIHRCWVKCGRHISVVQLTRYPPFIQFFSSQFKQISQAYEVLSDSQKREVYDRGGEKAIKGGGSGGGGGFGSPMDIFDMFFGGGGRLHRERRGKNQIKYRDKYYFPQKTSNSGLCFLWFFLTSLANALPQCALNLGKNVVHQLTVSLEDLFNGATRKLAVQKNVICERCEGRGGRKGAVEMCMSCHGTGMQVRLHQLGPGMVQQVSTVCGGCQGQGQRISHKDRCKACSGRKILRQKKILEVHIGKGMKDGQKLVFRGEGDQEPGLEPGDIIIVLDQRVHPVFTRQGDNLIMTMELQLVEALCGFQKPCQTLDNRSLLITCHPGELIKPGDKKCVMNEGMPMHRRPFENGRLIILFSVVFPEANFLPKHKLKELEHYLPAKREAEQPESMDDDLYIYTDLEDCDPARVRRSQYHYMEEDDNPSAGGVQCQTS